MSDYTKITDFAAKDALSTGTPSKAVKGTEIGAELDAIATMSTTKADKSMTEALLLEDGTVSAPALAFVSDTNTGLYSSAADELSIATAGTLRGTIGTTGTWTIPAATNTTLAVSNVASKYAIVASAAAGVSASVGIVGNGGASGTDDFLLQQNSGGAAQLTNRANANLTLGTNATTYMQMTAGGVISLWEGTYNGGTAAMMQGATMESGTYTGTLTGCTTGPTGNMQWVRSGNLVTITVPSLTATSNANTCTITGSLPANLQPATSQYLACLARFSNNSTTVTSVGVLMTAGSSTITFVLTGSATGFTSSGTKGPNALTSFTYHLV